MRRTIASLLCVLGLLLLPSPSPTSAVTFDPFPLPPADFPFRIASNHSGLCWDVPNGDFRRGQPVQQWFCHTGASQTWNIVQTRSPERGDFLLIRSAVHPSYCVGSRDRQLIIDKCDVPEGTLLEWRMDRRLAFHVPQIVAQRARGCIDVWAGTMSEGGPLQLFEDCHGGLNQAWVLLPSR